MTSHRYGEFRLGIAVDCAGFCPAATGYKLQQYARAAKARRNAVAKTGRMPV